MNKRINLIVGSGVLGAYLSAELLRKKEKVVVTTRSLNNKKNYNYLKIHKKVKFQKLDVIDKNAIKKILEKYRPDKIFYFAGQSSLTKSLKDKKGTFSSHFVGSKNFLDIIKEKKLKTKFFKTNSGYIFSSNNGYINLDCKFTSSDNPYILAQQKTFKLIKKYRHYGLNLSNLVLMQVESPLRDKEFFIKKVCLNAKKKSKVVVGNINTYRDYSWITEVVKAILLTSNLKSKDFFISSGKKISGKQILAAAYKLNKLNYKKYYYVNKKFFRKNEVKILVGSKKNTSYLIKKFKFKFNIFGNKLVREMYKDL